MAKYNEIMSRVSVTPEMRKRVLGNVIAHRQEDKNNAVNRKADRKRLMRWIPTVAAACFLLVIGLQVYYMNQSGEEPEDLAQESIIEYTSLAELEKAMGMDIPEIEPIPFEVTETVYTNTFGIARVDYYGENGENITLSKAKDTGTDVSGDYNEYTFEAEEEVDGVIVTRKGNGGTISLATWTKDGYAYALYANPGISGESMRDMVISALR